MAEYDIPANTDYIRNYTNASQIEAYIGHSQGTLQMFVKLCLDPSYSRYFKSYTAMAPIVFIDH